MVAALSPWCGRFSAFARPQSAIGLPRPWCPRGASVAVPVTSLVQWSQSLRADSPCPVPDRLHRQYLQPHRLVPRPRRARASCACASCVCAASRLAVPPEPYLSAGTVRLPHLAGRSTTASRLLAGLPPEPKEL